MSSKKSVYALALSISFGGVAFAQTSKGILAGVARDQSGAVITDATVTVTSQDTGESRNATTTSTGAYRVEAINPGTYELRVQMSGFTPVDVKGIQVLPSVVTSFDPVLKTGATSER